MPSITRITFVWNADFSLSGGLRALKEVVAGVHNCTLCAIAYHRVSQTSEWKDYKRRLASELKAEIREPCRNQLSDAEAAAAAGDYPAVLIHTSDGVHKVLGSREIDACRGDVAAFRLTLDEALARILNA